MLKALGLSTRCQPVESSTSLFKSYGFQIVVNLHPYIEALLALWGLECRRAAIVDAAPPPLGDEDGDGSSSSALSPAVTVEVAEIRLASG